MRPKQLTFCNAARTDSLAACAIGDFHFGLVGNRWTSHYHTWSHAYREARSGCQFHK